MHSQRISLDFPWQSLGSSVVVDVGAGIGTLSHSDSYSAKLLKQHYDVLGGMSMELAKRYPLLRFIVQDRAMVIQEAAAVWQKELPEALSSGRAELVTHNFFTEQPTKGADVYLLRHILYAYPSYPFSTY